MPSFLSPLFLIGSLAAAVPIVSICCDEPEPRVKFAAVRLCGERQSNTRTGGASGSFCCSRFGIGAGLAGAGVRAAVSGVGYRWSVWCGDHRGPRHVLQHVGAWAFARAKGSRRTRSIAPDPEIWSAS
jgi:hypothetical protein